ncbi:unnamed protein product [Bursaphelenchus xylophilus]|uniref:(pine wood nematode) hypothetical protein n=1 Tax=Bursaphelenchus xylophilus TaxID=6326 RepID=A0A1I7STQ0_BURXY|nr:unnamed protein product [Bursaphelenchus xylophilus]CAG9108125.1 unnamed protein product [Bursaphelenchus xylophilus]
MTSENARRDIRQKWTHLNSTDEKTAFIVNELRNVLGSFNDFNGKQPEGIALGNLQEYSYNDDNPHNAKSNTNPVILKEVEKIIEEMTDIPPLIERIDSGRPNQNGKMRSLPEKIDNDKIKGDGSYEIRKNGMSVEGIVDVMSLLEKPVSPLNSATLKSSPKSPEQENIKFSVKQRCVDNQRLPEFSDSGAMVESAAVKKVKLELPAHLSDLESRRDSAIDRFGEDRKSSRNHSPPKKMPKLAAETADFGRKQRDHKGKSTDSKSDKNKKFEQRSNDRDNKHRDRSEKKSSSKDYRPSHDDKEKSKSRTKSPEKRPLEKPVKLDVKPCASERNVSTPDLRPSSRLNSNKPTFRVIKPPSFAIGEYEGYDFPCPSRMDLPDQCVFMNRRKIPNHQELLSSVRQFIRSIPPNVISLGCMTRSLYSIGLLLYSLSPSHTTTESDLRQALALLRSVTGKLFNGHSALPKNKHIVKGLLCLAEALVCTKLYQENYNPSKKRRAFLKVYEEILRPTGHLEDGEILDSDFLERLVTDNNKNLVSQMAASDTVTIPRVLYKCMMEENAYSRLAEQALLANTMARNELELQEQGFLRRLRDMKFDLECSSSALGDAIFTVTFWMQRSTRFKPKTEPSKPS